MRKYFIDKWENFKDHVDLVKRLNEFEAIKRPPKKMRNPKSLFENKTERVKNVEKEG